MSAALSLALALAAPAHNPNPWEERLSEDGLQVWSRPVPGSDFLEWRAEKEMPVSADKLWTVFRDLEHYPDFMPYTLRAEVLPGSSETVRFVYVVIDPPVVSQRDYAQRVEYLHDKETGIRQILSRVVNERAPPLPDGMVRMPTLDGQWTLEPVNTSRTRAEYRFFSEPGGMIPSFLANNGGKSSMVDLFDALINRAKNPSWKIDD